MHEERDERATRQPERYIIILWSIPRRERYYHDEPYERNTAWVMTKRQADTEMYRLSKIHNEYWKYWVEPAPEPGEHLSKHGSYTFRVWVERRYVEKYKEIWKDIDP